jgi:hypothetical protein
MDDDGSVDLVVGERYPGSVEVLRGAGDGSFEALGPTFPEGVAPDDERDMVSGLALADFDGDGHTDVVTAAWDWPPMSLFRGNGNGTLQAGSGIEAPDNAHNVASADLDGDGAPEVVSSRHFGFGNVIVHRNLGDGSFVAAAPVAVGALPDVLVIADFDADGSLDVATTCGGSDDVTVLRGQGGGTLVFAAAIALHQGELRYNGGPVGLAAADFDGDGRLDLLAVNRTADTVSLLRQTSTEPLAFEARQVVPVCDNPMNVAAGDFDGDGVSDAAVSCIETEDDWFKRGGSRWPDGAIQILWSRPG